MTNIINETDTELLVLGFNYAKYPKTLYYLQSHKYWRNNSIILYVLEQNSGMKLAAGGRLEMCRIAGFALLEVFLGLRAFLQHDQWRLPHSCFHSCMLTLSVSSLSDTTEVTLSSLSPPPSAPWQPTRPPAPTPTRPREWTWPTASPTCGSKPKSTAWTRCPQSTERRGEEEGTPALPLLGLWQVDVVSGTGTVLLSSLDHDVSSVEPPRLPVNVGVMDGLGDSVMTSGRDAEAERLRSFYLCDRRRTLSMILETLLWTCWNSFLSLRLWIKLPDHSYFFQKGLHTFML